MLCLQGKWFPVTLPEDLISMVNFVCSYNVTLHFSDVGLWKNVSDICVNTVYSHSPAVTAGSALREFGTIEQLKCYKTTSHYRNWLL